MSRFALRDFRGFRTAIYISLHWLNLTFHIAIDTAERHSIDRILNIRPPYNQDLTLCHPIDLTSRPRRTGLGPRLAVTS